MGILRVKISLLYYLGVIYKFLLVHMFNATESKYVAFTAHHNVLEDSNPLFYMNDKLIERVKYWRHLGNILTNNQSDSVCINKRRDQMIGQINDVLSTFGKLDCIIKVDLLYKYCNSLYGSVLWNLSNPGILRICSAWRTALTLLVLAI
jgi:hypothetical protein